MAVVWAKSNGSWQNSSLWAYWDGSSIQNYGQVPQLTDVVYANGYQVSSTQNVEVDELRTDKNPYTNTEGGVFVVTSNNSMVWKARKIVISSVRHSTWWTTFGLYYSSGTTLGLSIIATESIELQPNAILHGNTNGYNGINLIQAPSIIMGANSSLSSNGISNSFIYQIVGNIYCDTECYLTNNSGGPNQMDVTFNITGNAQNVKIQKHTSSATTTMINIVGDISWKGYTAYGWGAEPQLNVVGNLSSDVTSTLGRSSINGNIYVKNDKILNFYGLTINGKIEYESTSLMNTGVMATNINISNPQTFTWHNISENKPNDAITILTSADLLNRQQYPPEDEVKEGTEYVWGEKVGTYQQPPESVVLDGYIYDNGDKIGSLENQNVVGCVTKEDVREGVALIGMGEVGTLVVPSVDDVREGVVFDNGSVGTLIVQGGGDRLRIADFSYYTNAQSDTYIVDLTEQDKPKFAVAEERVLIEMFPDLDLDNIPEKYFDDLFVKYLKYRLIVEYYRTAGINSTFTPSEPTTEIVNYQNVRNEVWLNSANIYLKAWAKKYPESIMKPQRILL
ncbi:MAG: hypothetical protein II663_06335 [Bacteroidales bacterium]|nr:hypothetical protein [Bacteroidales bacterium]